ncbi:ParB/RepB/Spo0J family partition protein [Cecembia rubra]|uniref:ParB-like nuclease family protein n=1 Tax=Cecembia rubra TaxID=1485585 RepID=A0A2P8E343_9BACT|nr:ParB/RepB/Spo0J family partition protein [Cecembia rubra]PSL03883.1 ParB-like nuclease family protein [Cecembia rubra]
MFKLDNGIQIPGEIDSKDSFVNFVLNQCQERKTVLMEKMKLKNPGSFISKEELFEYVQALKDFQDFDLVTTKFLISLFKCPEDYKIQLIEANKIKPRSISSGDKVEAFKKMIYESDFIPPVFVTNSFDLVDGHHRLLAAIELGYDLIPSFVLSGACNSNFGNQVVL